MALALPKYLLSYFVFKLPNFSLVHPGYFTKQQIQQKLNRLSKQSSGPDLLLLFRTHLSYSTPSMQP